MNPYVSKICKYILVAFLAVFCYYDLPAQPGPPGGGGDPPCWPPETCIPIDGGIGLLVAAGLAFGSKKAFDLGKKD